MFFLQEQELLRQLARIGIETDRAYGNLSADSLIHKAVEGKEGVVTSSGALSILTGKYTGRSPKDKFIVDEPSVHKDIEWGPVNQPMSQERFQKLYERVTAHLKGRELYVFDGFVGADPAYRLPIRVINEYAWQNLFAHQLFIRPSDGEKEPQFTVISAPSFHAVPQRDGTNSEAFVIVSFEKKIVLIGATAYAGETKKSIFTVMNYLLPKKGVFPMHASANIRKDGSTAIFFGLSGTGKTSLSADPEAKLIGDDEHGWSENGVFNLEGGCYAKCIRLSKEEEPQIWAAVNRRGAVIENAVVDPGTKGIDFNSDAITENTRSAYPIDFNPGAITTGVGGHPKTVFFLAADAFGILPPVAKLTAEGAMYHFLSGYTSKLAGTERGIIEPAATFSTCFGAPFLPLRPMEYARMFGERIREHKSRVFLLNTGWTGGPYGVGERIAIHTTRAMIKAALEGDLDDVSCRKHPVLNLLVPETCPGVDGNILDPRNTWSDAKEYDTKAKELAQMFVKNFTKFKGVPEEVVGAGPRP